MSARLFLRAPLPSGPGRRRWFSSLPPAPHKPPSYRPPLPPALVENGLQKYQWSSAAVFQSAVLGGVLLSLGGSVFVVVCEDTPSLRRENPGLHRLLGGLVFPMGLAMITLTSAHLLTSNFYFCSLPLLSGNPGFLSALRVCAASCAGNLCGSLCVALAVKHTIFSGEPAAYPWITALVEKKVYLSKTVAFVKAIGANFLVNVAVFMAFTSTTPAGKIASLWAPICCFVVLGLEHSVANMFLLPLGYMLGADVEVGEIGSQLVVVVLGNAVGALLLAILQGGSPRGLKALLAPLLSLTKK